MNKYDTPPVILVDDPRQVFEAFDADKLAEAHIETKPARYLIFAQEDAGWVLRDYLANRDYPFHTRHAALRGLALRDGRNEDFIGSPIEVNAYGEPLENVEVIA
ncbi:hypothetical protein QDW18_gp52 [Microbacterium phage Katzastrophic]|uniref:hypothetical protein n=1 Tax=Microbacterium phage Katzastrophic TaxID=2912654 RepID=UPI00242D8667|nr:hypothetical protein QDW18_gp52 [Microbacterium phage Katzastrophic]UKH48489.1 hypothetical protein SEA_KATZASTROPHIC_52 [Microbacterium phage Katzastrophic]